MWCRWDVIQKYVTRTACSCLPFNIHSNCDGTSNEVIELLVCDIYDMKVIDFPIELYSDFFFRKLSDFSWSVEIFLRWPQHAIKTDLANITVFQTTLTNQTKQHTLPVEVGDHLTNITNSPMVRRKQSIERQEDRTLFLRHIHPHPPNQRQGQSLSRQAWRIFSTTYQKRRGS